MTLDEYRKEKGLTYNDIAAAIGLGNPMTVMRYCKGQRIPKPDMMKKIYDFSGGAVAPSDYYDFPS